MTGETVYHVNPETNRPNICRNEPGKCSVATRAKHYETAEAAKEALSKKPKAAKKPAEPKPEAVEVTTPEEAANETAVDASTEEKIPADEQKTDIIDILIQDSLRDKTEEELRPQRPAGFFENLSENGTALAKKAAQEAEEFKDSVAALPKNPKVTETTEKLKNAAADGLNRLETLGKSSLGKLKGAFGKRKR